MNCYPFMRAVVESVTFFGLSDDNVLQPDTAVAQLENLASILRELDESDISGFRRFVDELATTEEATSGRTPRVDFLFHLVDNLFDVQ